MLNEKLQNRRRQLASARKQPDDERTTIERSQKEIAQLENELDVLRGLWRAQFPASPL